jgi:hypothetical protein
MVALSRRLSAASQIIGVAIVLNAACAGTESESDRTLQQDSAGIQIVESLAGEWQGNAVWRLHDEPLLELGAGMEGDTAEQFVNVRAVRMLGDGRIVVADAGTFSLKFFDSTGRVVARAGGEGRGPGELGIGLLRGMIRCAGDSIRVVGTDRITVYAPGGAFVRTVTLRWPPGELGDPRWCLAGRVVAATRHGGWPTSPGIRTDSVTLNAFTTDGELLWTRGPFAFQDRSYVPAGGEGFGYAPAPFGRTLSVASNDSVLAMTFGETEIRVLDSNGALQRIVRARLEPRPLSGADVVRFRDFVLGDFRGNALERRSIEDQLSGSDLPKNWPAVGELVFDDAGNLWARQYDYFDAVSFYNWAAVPGTRDGRTREFPDEPRPWLVFDAGGKLLGQVATPPGFVVHDIRLGRVVGVWRDDLDVVYVRVYRIESAN